ncbi:MAG: MarR family transcriptional regulator [Coriobacteriia bacterium]|nr:MarR family transcriptional regulator [Coriobacteriia bacterium]
MSDSIMLRIMDNTAYISNASLAPEVQRRLREQLPPTWRIESERGATQVGPDAVLRLEAPDGKCATVLVEIKRQLDPVAVPRVLEQMQAWVGWPAETRATTTYLVAAPYLSERTRERLRDKGLNYLDFTGNTLVSIEDPAVYVRTQGAVKDPNRSARPTRSFRGVKTAQIVRALVDRAPPLGVRQIAGLVGTDPGNVSRVLDLLEREDLIERSPQGGVQGVNWSELLRAWSRDYSLMGSNRPLTYLDARGLGNFVDRLKSLPSGLRFAVTGSLAAGRMAPVAPARLGVAFVDDAAAVAQALGLVPADAGANIVLLEPKGEFVFDRSKVDAGVRYVAPSQAVVDLLTGSGRNPDEAEELLEWMRRNENAWRA